MTRVLSLLGLALFLTPALGQLHVSHAFDNHMVVQRDQPVRVWGRAAPLSQVRVRFGPRDLTVKADAQGHWRLELDGLPASTLPHSLHVQSGRETVEYDNILVGDVWVLGGQSNMEDVLESIYHGDTEVASANYAHIRLLTVPQVARPRPQAEMERLNEFNSWTGRHEQKGSWHRCTPKSVARFSAIGYIFGRRLHQVSGVPIGLIDASWGGTTIEAWVARRALKQIPAASHLTQTWDKRSADYDPAASLAARIARWEKDTARREREGKPANPKPTEPEQDPATNRNNPGAAFNGMIAPLANLNIKGVIFNQGYNNALGRTARPKLYSETFRAMIVDWRRAFRQDKLPFGIVALTPGGEPQTLDNFEISMVDPAPYIREAQARVWRELPQVGFAPAYDQQVPWYHPHKKFELGERIARWALHTQYGQQQLGWQPAICTDWEIKPGGIELAFDRNVRVHDGRPFSGFAIAGKDRHFYPADAEFVVKGTDERGREQMDESRLWVSSPQVTKPVAVRYAWARNPLGNAVNSQHHERTIPIVSFRTDSWDWPEAPPETASHEEKNAHNQALYQARESARKGIAKRRVEWARWVLENELDAP